MAFAVTKRAIKASRCCAGRSRRQSAKGGICTARMTTCADGRITFIGGLVRSRTACACPEPCAGVGCTRSMAGETRGFRVPARKIIAVACLATGKTSQGAGLLRPCAMHIRVRPISDTMLSGIWIYRGVLVLFAASRDHKDEPEEKNDGSFYFSYR
jgi:hypothetical protein